MESDRDNALWTALLPAALLVLCCGAPLLVAAASAGIFAAAVAWVGPYRAYLVATAVLLAGIAVYAGRRPPAACCEEGDAARVRRVRPLGVVAGIGAIVAAIVAGLSVIVP